MIYHKTDVVALCDHLTQKEFACKCKYSECSITLVSKTFIECYKKFRALVNMPLMITSGYRCILHQKDLLKQESSFKKANPTAVITSEPAELSRHMCGEAMDVSLANLKQKPEFLKELALQSGFTYVYYDTSKNFLHVDCRQN
jgi:uncharacterized protein YcbK (DUF882 family)